MKTLIMVSVVLVWAARMSAQNSTVQLDELHTVVDVQNELMLISTFGEGVIGMDFMNELAIIHGFYPLALYEETSSLNDLQPIEGLSAFPIPTNDKLMLRCQTVIHRLFKVALYDGSGKAIYKTDWVDGLQCEMSCAVLEKGVYYLLVSDPSTARMSTFQVVVH